MGWELETVEKPFFEQLLTMGCPYVDGNIDDTARTGMPIVVRSPP